MGVIQNEIKGIPGNGSKRHPVIEFDAATDAPSDDTSVEVEILEKLDDVVVAEDAAASESAISEEFENAD